MRSFILSILLLIASGFAYSTEKPNVIIIYADDLGYGDLSCYGATQVKTPRIDSLATDGRKFTDGHSPSAVCTPSRYSLLTGEYPFKKGLYSPIFLKSPLIMSEDTYTIADLMKSAGYKTGIVGKWHLGFQKNNPVNWNAPLKPGPIELGFDYYYGVPTVNSHPPFVYVENHHVVGHIYDKESPDYDPFDYNKSAGKQGYTAKVHEKMKLDQIGGAKAAHSLYKDYEVGLHLAGKTVDWIDQNKEDPFFLILATTHIHHPFTPAPQFQGTSEAGLYGDFLHELDHIVGMIIDKLEAEGLTDNTMIIFTADNGAMMNITGQEAYTQHGHRPNGPLLGAKSDGWEGGHRVPFLVKWPAKVPAGTTSNQLISAVDLMASLASITNTDLQEGASPDGIDMSEALIGNPEKQIREHLVCTPIKKSFLVLRNETWAYLGGQGSAGWNGKVNGHTFSGTNLLTFFGDTNSDIKGNQVSKDAAPAQLYNLKDDLSQTTNLYHKHPEVVEEMSQILDGYIQQSPLKKKPNKKSK